jgi:hypothetical protein
MSEERRQFVAGPSPFDRTRTRRHLRPARRDNLVRPAERLTIEVADLQRHLIWVRGYWVVFALG